MDNRTTNCLVVFVLFKTVPGYGLAIPPELGKSVHMVLEYVTIEIYAGLEEKFEAAYWRVFESLDGADGLASASLHRGVERPSRFVLCVQWESVAHHERFRTTAGYAAWRDAVAAYFAESPHAEHFEPLAAPEEGQDP